MRKRSSSVDHGAGIPNDDKTNKDALAPLKPNPFFDPRQFDPSKFSFSPFEYIKRLRHSQLDTLDPTQLIDQSLENQIPQIEEVQPNFSKMRRQSVVAEFAIYNDLKALIQTLPKSEHIAIIEKYSTETGTKDLKQDF